MNDHSVCELSLNEIVPGNNDRRSFESDALSELAQSIAEHGLIQPITVRPLGDTELYQIVAGERRFRAVQHLGWSTIPAIVKELSDEEASVLMLAENMARADLNPIEEAHAYASRIRQFGWSVERCAEAAGVSEIRVQFRIKILALREDLQDMVRKGTLGLGYAQILASAALDSNRQMIAIRRLRDNPSATPGWFRSAVNELSRQQAEQPLFEMPLFAEDSSVAMPAPIDPPHPSTCKPPKTGSTAAEILRNQSMFWTTAAEAWALIGKPFKRQECEAAALGLQLAMESMPW